MPSKSVLLTGCSDGGLGAAMALALANRGHHVFATARDTQKIPENLTSLSNVTVLRLDVVDVSSVTEAAQTVTESGRGLDALVNNAGGGYAQPILDIDISRAQQLHDINVWGPVRTIQAFASLLIASGGRVVNISSVGAIVNTPWIGIPANSQVVTYILREWSTDSLIIFVAAYASSKAALNNISETLRLELSPLGVSVVTIMTGVVNSKFHVNDSDFKLAPDSRYTPIGDIIATWASGAAKPKGDSAESFAESVVEDIVGCGKGGILYKGAHAGSVKFMAQWLPATLGDVFMSQGQGLQELFEGISRVQSNDSP